jgi:hypothetical protein
MDANLSRAQQLLGVLAGQRNDAQNRVAELTVDLTNAHAALAERDGRIAEMERAVAAMVAANAGPQEAAGDGVMQPADGLTDLGGLE